MQHPVKSLLNIGRNEMNRECKSDKEHDQNGESSPHNTEPYDERHRRYTANFDQNPKLMNESDTQNWGPNEFTFESKINIS